MPDDNRMVLVAVIPADLMAKIEERFGERIHTRGDMFATDLTKETDAELSDDAVKVLVKVRRKDGAGA
jgi:hypothetical protein